MATNSRGAEEPERSETLYLQLAESFTIQLLDSASMMQIKLALRTPYGQPMVDEISSHEIGIRAALLEPFLASKARRLLLKILEVNRARLRGAANAILEEQSISRN